MWIVFVGMFYINMYVLLPRFFFKGKYEIYILLLILLVTSCLFVVVQMVNYIYTVQTPTIETQRYHIMNFVNGIFVCISIILTTTTLKLFNRWIQDNKRISELKNLALKTELASLKNQIQPHFLFNMLNNVKALIRKDSEMATEVIMKLSDFLRYQLYENNGDKTLLISEINFISNFLKLEEIRRDHLITTLQYDPEIAKKNIFLPPHLFTAFVENAIKHSLSATEEPTFIHISFTTTERQLSFECKNSTNPSLQFPKSQYGGLGLTNAKRRLELLYQNEYHLDIAASDTDYIVKLTIPI
ncbi:histidine kinase [Sphingobacterium sp. SRCM116780]|uniref:sensor histidine kinase n=1 Tax=Sphingobacterium sp. SRCM116780 TaxID=2907623 RepID=UPI001F17B3E6|nr:histidine kinase [Sphingobacterium sp. SRCM116780]UIR54867.1 histidine kinase [Sphingobacterium sp. SRCM116780]